MEKLQSIRIIILWFGPWPEWMRFFIESCRWNPTVDWLIYGDAPPPEDLPPNMRIVTMTLQNYQEVVASRLGIKLDWTEAYKLCDVKPALGFIHDREIAGYDYWGFGDLDVIYGDIRRFYTPEVLCHDLINTHTHVISGHFCLLRTTPRMVTAFKRIPRWQTFLSTPEHKSFDERIFSRLFLPLRGKQALRRLYTPYMPADCYFEERFSTNISTYLKWVDDGTEWPRHWFWDRGHLTTDRSGDRELLYLHFSHWQSNRWTGSEIPPWKKLERLSTVFEKRPTGFTISAKGVTPLSQPAMAEA